MDGENRNFYYRYYVEYYNPDDCKVEYGNGVCVGENMNDVTKVLYGFYGEEYIMKLYLYQHERDFGFGLLEESEENLFSEVCKCC